MSNFFKTKYRVVKDSYLGYEAQYKPWWFPFYRMIGFSNTSRSFELAYEIIERHKKYGCGKTLYEE
jgi:hypothetical protein